MLLLQRFFLFSLKLPIAPKYFDLGSFLENAATGALGSLPQIAGSIWNSERNLAYQKQIDKKTFDEAVRQYNQNYEQTEKWNTISQNNFENATQIRTADMAKAGLNPILAAGAESGQTISPAQSSTVSNQQSQAKSQVDFSAFTELIRDKMAQKAMADENEENRKIERRKLDLEEEKIDNQASQFLLSHNLAVAQSDEIIRHNKSVEKIEQEKNRIADAEHLRQVTKDNLESYYRDLAEGPKGRQSKLTTEKLQTEIAERARKDKLLDLQLNQYYEAIREWREEFDEKKKNAKWEHAMLVWQNVLNTIDTIARSVYLATGAFMNLQGMSPTGF